MTKEDAARILDPATTVEALAEIEYYAGFSGQAAKVQAVSDACEIAVAALREQLATNCHQLEPVTNRNGLTGWISVEDRLPPDEKTVLAYYGYDIDGSGGSGLMFVGTLCYFCFDPDPHWQHAGNGLFVTHWIPLPAAPEEKENPHETKTND